MDTIRIPTLGGGSEHARGNVLHSCKPANLFYQINLCEEVMSEAGNMPAIFAYRSKSNASQQFGGVGDLQTEQSRAPFGAHLHRMAQVRDRAAHNDLFIRHSTYNL